MNQILVVEDENWLAMELAWLVQEAGYAVLGPERSVAEAQKALGRVKVDLALADIRLGSETVFPISEKLEAMGIPFDLHHRQPRLASRRIQRAAAARQAVDRDVSVVRPPSRRSAIQGHRMPRDRAAKSDNGSGSGGRGYMPIIWGVNHAARLVTARATGELSRTDIEDYLDGLAAAATLSFRKVLDMSDSRLALSGDDMAAIGSAHPRS